MAHWPIGPGVSVQQGQGAPGSRPLLCQEHGTKPGTGTGRAAEAAALPHAHQLGGPQRPALKDVMTDAWKSQLSSGERC